MEKTNVVNPEVEKIKIDYSEVDKIKNELASIMKDEFRNTKISKQSNILIYILLIFWFVYAFCLAKEVITDFTSMIIIAVMGIIISICVNIIIRSILPWGRISEPSDKEVTIFAKVELKQTVFGISEAEKKVDKLKMFIAAKNEKEDYWLDIMNNQKEIKKQ